LKDCSKFGNFVITLIVIATVNYCCQQGKAIFYLSKWWVESQYRQIKYSLTLVATVADCNNVAAHVHCDTIVVAVSPVLTLPPASKAVSNIF
jgi:hypothetical protein